MDIDKDGLIDSNEFADALKTSFGMDFLTRLVFFLCTPVRVTGCVSVSICFRLSVGVCSFTFCQSVSQSVRGRGLESWPLMPNCECFSVHLWQQIVGVCTNSKPLKSMQSFAVLLCCAVLCCAVLCYAMPCCGVVWCAVLWCADGAVTRRQWPGCLPTGTGKREGCVCCARDVCGCVFLGGKRGYAVVPAAVAAAGPMRRGGGGGARAPALAAARGRGSIPRRGALVALPARHAPPPSARVPRTLGLISSAAFLPCRSKASCYSRASRTWQGIPRKAGHPALGRASRTGQGIRH